MLNNILFALSTLVVSATVHAEIIEPDLHTVRYKVFYDQDDVGSLTKSYRKENDHYVLESTSDIEGFYGIIPVSDKRKEISTFDIGENGFYKAISYNMVRTGTWLDFENNILFDYEQNKIDLKYKKRVGRFDIEGEILDAALFNLKMQQQAKNGNKSVHHKIAFKDSLKTMSFLFVKEEVIDTKYGKTNAVMYQRTRDYKHMTKKADYAWFDKDRDFIMVKALFINKKGKEEARFEIDNYEKL